MTIRLLYGVCGEGAGHAARSAVVARHLLSRGVDVRLVATSPSAVRYLAARLGPDHAHRVSQTVGFTLAYRQNRASLAHTVFENVARLPLAALAGVAPLARVVAEPPDVVISDFDPWSAWVAARMGRPLIALDNVHFVNRCRHSPAVTRADQDQQAEQTFRLYADRCVPGARRYMVTALGQPLARRPLTTLHMPVVRAEVQRARWARRDDGPVVAYFNSMADHAAVRGALSGAGRPVHLYGDPTVTAESGAVAAGSVLSLPFSEEAFVRDLSACSFVVGGAGFTLASEAAYLGKPMLCVPFGGQYEQLLNASYHEALGYGRRCDAGELTRDAVRSFAADAPAMARQLQTYRHDDNRELLAAVTDEVEAAAFGGGGAWPRGAGVREEERGDG